MTLGARYRADDIVRWGDYDFAWLRYAFYGVMMIFSTSARQAAHDYATTTAKMPRLILLIARLDGGIFGLAQKVCGRAKRSISPYFRSAGDIIMPPRLRRITSARRRL